MKIGGIAGATLLAGGAVVLNNSGWGGAGWMNETIETTRQRILTESANLGLAVNEVWVEGRRRTPARQVFAALDIQRGIPLFGFDPAAAKARIEALPWVKRAAVERRMPDTVVIEIEEHEPIALWQRAGRFVPIGRNGVAILDDGVESFSSLPVVIGDEAPARTARLFKTLATRPMLKDRIAAAILVGGRRWDLRLDNGATVRLPEENVDAAWSRLAELERTHHLLAGDSPGGRANGLLVVDLRLPDRLVLRRIPDKSGGEERTGKEA
jgi:cell division protein FtsQ